jgi:hypothetical protein
MNLPMEDQDFLRQLVKTSRQRSEHVRWVDRDGTPRITTLNSADATRAKGLARTWGLTLEELFRQAAHLPAATK